MRELHRFVKTRAVSFQKLTPPKGRTDAYTHQLYELQLNASPPLASSRARCSMECYCADTGSLQVPASVKIPDTAQAPFRDDKASNYSSGDDMKRCFEAPGNVIGRGINPAAIQGMLVQSLHFETPGLLRFARNDAVPAVIARRLWAPWRSGSFALHSHLRLLDCCGRSPARYIGLHGVLLSVFP